MDFNSVKWMPDITCSGTRPVKSEEKADSAKNKEDKIKEEAMELETMLKSKLVLAKTSDSFYRTGVSSLIEDSKQGKDYISLNPKEGNNGIKTHIDGVFKRGKTDTIRVYKMGPGGYMGDEVYKYDEDGNLVSYTAATKDGYDEKSPIDMRKTNKTTVTFNN